jgi:DNA-binding transcriptional regulator YiaG
MKIPVKTSRMPAIMEPVTGKAVAELRVEFGMSQSKLARLLGVSVTSIMKWKKTSGLP